MRFRTELESGGEKNAVHFDADGACEFELDAGVLPSFEAAGEDASAAGQNGAREEPYRPGRVR